MAVCGLFILLILSILVLAAPLYTDYSKAITLNIAERFQAPSAEYWFGTDSFGRDLFARVAYGGRISLFAGLAVVFLSVIIGCILGGAAGYFGGWADTLIMRVVDIFMAVPPLLLSLAVCTALGEGTSNLIIALVITSIPRFTRIVRSSILTLRGQEFIEAAQCCGTSSFRIICKHILPNGIGPIIVSATLTLGQIILSISSMGFLGLGVASPMPEWGTIISENKLNIRYCPYLAIAPGVCICLVVMAVNFIGDGLRDAFDPKSKN